MTDGFASTETDAAARLAQHASILIEAGESTRYVVAVPPGWGTATLDLESALDNPLRARGTIDVNSPEAFAAAVNQRGVPVVYFSHPAATLVAVLNDDTGEDAGWRDYRVDLLSQLTPEWKHWREADGRMMSQEKFAQHIEDGLAELTDPAPAAMLDLAQTFHATTAAKFRAGRRLADGRTQFLYEEEIDAKAGEAGTLEIPKTLTLSVAPYYGSEVQTVNAWFRYRLNRDGLTLGYRIERAYTVEQRAFALIVERAQELLGDIPFIAGPAPDRTR